MNDTQALRIALRNMQEAEGVVATERLISDALSSVATKEDRRRAKQITEIRGVGKATALEVMAAIGRLMGENDVTI